MARGRDPLSMKEVVRQDKRVKARNAHRQLPPNGSTGAVVLVHLSKGARPINGQDRKRTEQNRTEEARGAVGTVNTVPTAWRAADGSKRAIQSCRVGARSHVTAVSCVGHRTVHLDG
jgi:hypothetical protein